MCLLIFPSSFDWTQLLQVDCWFRASAVFFFDKPESVGQLPFHVRLSNVSIHLQSNIDANGEEGGAKNITCKLTISDFIAFVYLFLFIKSQHSMLAMVDKGSCPSFQLSILVSLVAYNCDFELDCNLQLRLPLPILLVVLISPSYNSWRHLLP